MRPHLPFILLASAAVPAAGCSSQKHETLPSIDELQVVYRFEQGERRSYTIKCTAVSPTAGIMTSSRSLSISWTQEVKRTNGDGSARMENVIEDVVFETEGADFSAGNINSAIRGALKGTSYIFDVTPRGAVSGASGDKIDWKKSFERCFEKEKTPAPLRRFILSMMTNYFSTDQVISILSTPFRMLPGRDSIASSKWKEERNFPFFGINAESSTWSRADKIEKHDGRTVLVIRMDSSRLGGAATLDVPAQDAPLLMEVEIVEGAMEGLLHFDPVIGAVVHVEERYGVTVEAGTGLPSLDPDKEIKRLSPPVTMSVDYKITLDLAR